MDIYTEQIKKGVRCIQGDLDQFTLNTFELNSGEMINISSEGFYLFLLEGKLVVNLTSYNEIIIHDLMYAAAYGTGELVAKSKCKGIMIICTNIKPLFSFGGPIENVGRLKYIDGCSDTLLISPSRLGEPCLNLLHFPAQTNQTMHHHPSFRFGMVVTGTGESVGENGKVVLNEGDVFYIPKNIEHKFNTYQSEMNVIAFHPDSDWGPTDETHPMKNRTWFK